MPSAPARRGFDLGDYVEVHERIRMFYEAFPEGRLATTEVRMTADPDGKPRVVVEAAAWRTPDDPIPGRGWSWMELPGSSSYTRGSELENTETSAWGRAIGALGIGLKGRIASAQEVRNKEGEQEREDGGLIGIAQIGKGKADFELRQTPDGWALSFKLMAGRRGIRVDATGLLAEQIAEHRAEIEGQRVTCHGAVATETFTPRDASREVTYSVLKLERIETPAGAFPAPREAEAPAPDVGSLDDLPGWS